MSDFDKSYIFAGRQRVALGGDGLVKGIHKADDTNYWDDGSEVDWAAYAAAGWNCMVRQPRYYYYQAKIGSIWRRSASPTPRAGHVVHPAFVTSDGTVKNCYYVSAFEGWVDTDGKLRSLPGKQPTTSITRSQLETYAANNGTGYINFDFNTLWSEQLLWTIEFAEMNAQSIFRGIVDLDSGDDNHSQNTGHTCELGNASGEVEVAPDNPATGDTTSIVKPFSFRGHENLYGNVRKNISGWTKTTNGTHNIMGVDYVVENDDESGYSTDFESGAPGFVPCKTSGGSDTTFTCDYLYRNASTNRAALYGGFWCSGGPAGAFFDIASSWPVSGIIANRGAQ